MEEKGELIIFNAVYWVKSIITNFKFHSDQILCECCILIPSIGDTRDSTIKELLNGCAVPIRGLLKVKKHLYSLTIEAQLYGLVKWSLDHTNSYPLQLLLDSFP